jgi:glycosyltransferase 2 family protein
MKQTPGEAGHASLLGVEDGSGESASDTGLPSEKVWVPAAVRQAGGRGRVVVFWGRLLVALSILAFILSRIDIRSAALRLSPALLAAVATATGLWLVSQGVAALRWRLVLGENVLPWSYLLRLYVIGSFFGLFLPTSVGGDAVRALAAIRASKKPGRAAASVLIDRGFGVLATLGFGVIGLLWAPSSARAVLGNVVNWQRPGMLAIFIVFVASAALIAVYRRSAKTRVLWKEGMRTLGDLLRSPKRLGRVLLLALMAQGTIVLLWYTLARGMGFRLPIVTFLWTVPVVNLSALLPVTFAGLGVREGVWLWLLADKGISSADIVAFSLLYFGCNILVATLGAAMFVSRGLEGGSTPPRCE